MYYFPAMIETRDIQIEKLSICYFLTDLVLVTFGHSNAKYTLINMIDLSWFKMLAKPIQHWVDPWLESLDTMASKNGGKHVVDWCVHIMVKKKRKKMERNYNPLISFKNILAVTQGPVLKLHLICFPPRSIIETLGTKPFNLKTFEWHLPKP